MAAFLFCTPRMFDSLRVQVPSQPALKISVRR